MAGNLELDALLNMIFAHPEVARYLVRETLPLFCVLRDRRGHRSQCDRPLGRSFPGQQLRGATRPPSPLYQSTLFRHGRIAGLHHQKPPRFLCRHRPNFWPHRHARRYTRSISKLPVFPRQRRPTNHEPRQSAERGGMGAYHQGPDYHELWINADTLRKRKEFVDRILVSGSNGMKADILTFTASLTNAANPNTLISEVLELLHTLPSAQTGHHRRPQKHPALQPKHRRLLDHRLDHLPLQPNEHDQPQHRQNPPPNLLPGRIGNGGIPLVISFEFRVSSFTQTIGNVFFIKIWPCLF